MNDETVRRLKEAEGLTDLYSVASGTEVATRVRHTPVRGPS